MSRRLNPSSSTLEVAHHWLHRRGWVVNTMWYVL